MDRLASFLAPDPEQQASNSEIRRLLEGAVEKLYRHHSRNSEGLLTDFGRPRCSVSVLLQLVPSTGRSFVEEHPLEVSMLLIRPAVRTDVYLIKTLIHEMGEYERLPVLITEETLAHDGFGPRQEFRVLIADWDSEPAGYAFFFNCYSTFRGRGLFLEDLFVRPQFRGKKVGDALLSHVAAVARDEACFGIMLNVLGWNRPAIEFFRKHRATLLDDWKTACVDGEALQILAATK